MLEQIEPRSHIGVFTVLRLGVFFKWGLGDVVLAEFGEPCLAA